MREVVQVASRSVISINNKSHEIVVSNRLVEIVISNAPIDIIKPIPGGLKIDFVVLTATNILQKKAYITSEKVGGILLDIIGGCPQLEGEDYTVGENFIAWAGLGLEELMEEGDILRLAYSEAAPEV